MYQYSFEDLWNLISKIKPYFRLLFNYCQDYFPILLTELLFFETFMLFIYWNVDDFLSNYILFIIPFTTIIFVNLLFLFSEFQSFNQNIEVFLVSISDFHPICLKFKTLSSLALMVISKTNTLTHMGLILVYSVSCRSKTDFCLQIPNMLPQCH